MIFGYYAVLAGAPQGRYDKTVASIKVNRYDIAYLTIPPTTK
jgi:hypothetical protein